MHTEIPALISCLVGVIGLFGIVAAIVARGNVKKEVELLDRGADGLLRVWPSAEAGGLSPEDWLNRENLPSDSHIGDYVIAVWGGWLKSRTPTLGELQHLSASRERRRWMARLAGDIASLLVVAGIAGTLISIHPVLAGFDIASSAKGTVEGASQGDKAMQMIKDLGSAFWPSLTALLFTVVIGGFRALYLHATTKLAWKLNRFAIDDLLPKFLLPTFGDQLTEVQRDLRRLVASMEERDETFGTFVETFGTAVEGLATAGPGLQTAAEAVSRAADTLTTDAQAVLAGLDTHLGADSLIVRWLTAIETASRESQGVAERLEGASRHLAAASQELTGRADRAAREFEKTALAGSKLLIETSHASTRDATAAVNNAGMAMTEKLGAAVVAVPGIIRNGSAEAGATLVQACRESANGAAAVIGQSAHAAAATLKAEVAPIVHAATAIDAASRNLQDDVRGTLKSFGEDLRQTTRTALDGVQQSIDEAGQQILAAQEAASQAVETAGQLADRLEKWQPRPSWTKRTWQQLTGIFPRKR